MLNREMQSVAVLTFADTVDTHYQKRTGTATSSRNVDMVVKIFAQTNVTDIRYATVELIGITKDNAITDKNVITINNVNYDVLYVIPSGKYYQVLMRKK